MSELDAVERMDANDLIEAFNRMAEGLEGLNQPRLTDLIEATREAAEGLSHPFWEGDPPDLLVRTARKSYRLIIQLSGQEIPR